MKEFLKKLQTKNKENFSKLNYERIKCYLRRDLYEHIIGHEEKDYFDLDHFDKERLNNTQILEKIVEEVCKELEELGWHTQTSYGGTGLFIYSDEPPANCFPDGLT